MDLRSVLQKEERVKQQCACQPTGPALCVQLKQHLQVNTKGRSTMLSFSPSLIGPSSYYVDTIVM